MTPDIQSNYAFREKDSHCVFTTTIQLCLFVRKTPKAFSRLSLLMFNTHLDINLLLTIKHAESAPDFNGYWTR